LNDTYGRTLNAAQPELTARTDPGLPAPGRTNGLNSLARSAPVRSLGRAFAFGAGGVLLAALTLVAVATVPSLFGYHTYTIDGDSMKPMLNVGDAAVTKPSSPRNLKVGDVIVRRDIQGGQPVIHRIIDVVTVGGQLAFITQGDQNSAPDVQPVILSGSGERVIYSVPYAGYLLSVAESWPGRFLLIGLPLVLLAAALAGDVQRGIRPARRAADTRIAAPVRTPTPATIRDVAHLAEQLNSWALRRFVLRHSGGYRRIRQCAQHPPISGMTTLQILAALQHETSLSATSQRLAETCAELGVPYTRATSVAGNAYGQSAA